MAKKVTKKTARKAEPQFNKSKAIRDFLEANPGATNRDVAAALAKFGVTTNYVGTIKVNMKNKAGKKVAAKKKAVARKKTTVKRKAPAKKQQANDLVSISALQEAKVLAAKLGGVEQARAAIDAWASLNE